MALTLITLCYSPQDGFLSKEDLLAGCATLGVVPSKQELETLMPLMKTNEEGAFDYHSFISVFTEESQ